MVRGRSPVQFWPSAPISNSKAFQRPKSARRKRRVGEMGVPRFARVDGEVQSEDFFGGGIFGGGLLLLLFHLDAKRLKSSFVSVQPKWRGLVQDGRFAPQSSGARP